jgi:hypothetical protein
VGEEIRKGNWATAEMTTFAHVCLQDVSSAEHVGWGQVVLGFAWEELAHGRNDY